MSLRFQKRIKIWKGVGININKSSITPSYRGKRGSVSKKGYSIKTGIPGLTYRKNFTKTKQSGCLSVFIIMLLMMIKSLTK